jgi:imidazoleglycerol-phosphate dehydratase
MARLSSLERRTKETDITLELNLDGSGKGDIVTPSGFFSHMLGALARHSGFDLTCRVQGDVDVDLHHTVEDTGLVLGRVLLEALGDKAGIERYGQSLLPMDDALVLVAVDLSGRPYFASDLTFPQERAGEFPAVLALEFFRAFAQEGKFNLHLVSFRGQETHHLLEAAFKGLARALRQAAASTGSEGDVLSTKGVL